MDSIQEKKTCTIGIIQGRLTPPANSKLQCFPYGRWEEEFDLARACGLDAIELIYEGEWEPNPENPLRFPEGLERLRRVVDRTGVAVSSICVDYLMQFPLQMEGTRSAARQVVMDLLTKSEFLGGSRLVLPFFESAEIHGPSDLENLMVALKPCLDFAQAQGLELALETTLEAVVLLPFLREMDHPSLGVCYDLGNTTALGHDLPRDIKLFGGWIRHVHVKDRKKNGGPNVLLGMGDADFDGAFQALRDVSYPGPLILETPRGEDPVATAKRHREFVLKHRNLLDRGRRPTVPRPIKKKVVGPAGRGVGLRS